MLKTRLASAIENAGGLFRGQHGFRPGSSTVGAIEDVVKSVENERCASNSSRRLVLLATLDVRNAFNSVRWADMAEALEKRFNTPY